MGKKKGGKKRNRNNQQHQSNKKKKNFECNVYGDGNKSEVNSVRKIIPNEIKSKIKLNQVEINTKEAEKIIADFKSQNIDNNQSSKTKSSEKNRLKSKKISKK